MTLKERARKFAGESGTATMEAVIEAAIRDELLEIALDLERSAAHKIEMYASLGLSGEDQARPLRDMAGLIRQRLGT